MRKVIKVVTPAVALFVALGLAGPASAYDRDKLRTIDLDDWGKYATKDECAGMIHALSIVPRHHETATMDGFTGEEAKEAMYVSYDLDLDRNPVTGEDTIIKHIVDGYVDGKGLKELQDEVVDLCDEENLEQQSGGS